MSVKLLIVKLQVCSVVAVDLVAYAKLFSTSDLFMMPEYSVLELSHCLCCCQRLPFGGGLRLTSATSYAIKNGHTG